MVVYMCRIPLPYFPMPSPNPLLPPQDSFGWVSEHTGSYTELELTFPAVWVELVAATY